MSALLNRCSDTNRDVRLHCSECIGLLGAIDPGHLAVEIPPDKREDEGCDQLAIDLIKGCLVKSLKASATSQAQNRALFAIQVCIHVYMYLWCGMDDKVTRFPDITTK
jgi:hypothetical protein